MYYNLFWPLLKMQRFVLVLVLLVGSSLTCNSLSANEAVNKGQEFIWSARDSEGGWPYNEAHRMITTLALTSDEKLPSQTCDAKISIKQLELDLAIALAKHHTSRLSSGQLALYINSLIAICKNPRDFHGLNLVSRLKHYVESSPKVPHPYTIALKGLSLCLSGVHMDDHTQNKLMEIANPANQTDMLNSPDTQALAILALSCVGASEKTHYSDRQSSMRQGVKLMKSYYNPTDGSFGNIISSALVYQAFIAADTNEQGWNRTKAKEYILSKQSQDGSFENLLTVYFALPGLAGKSLVDIKHRTCTVDKQNEITPVDSSIENQTVGGVIVDIDVYGGEELSFSKNIRAENNTTLYTVLDSEFRCEWRTTTLGPMLISVNGISQDPDNNKYWMMYKMERNEHGSLVEKNLDTGAGSYHITKDTDFVLKRKQF